jgi:2'-5' RNA ligase
MAKTVVIDELHLTVRIPANLPDAQADAVRETLAGAEFTDRLRRSIRAAVRAFPELDVVRVTLAR